jgi:hypothetical protein
MSVLRKLVISWHAELLVAAAMAGGIIGIRTGL